MEIEEKIPKYSQSQYNNAIHTHSHCICFHQIQSPHIELDNDFWFNGKFPEKYYKPICLVYIQYLFIPNFAIENRKLKIGSSFTFSVIADK